MVIIYSKTLEKKKGVDDVSPRERHSLLREHSTMSKGTTLFSCGTVEDRWLALARGCVPAGASLERLWDTLPEARPPGGHSWHGGEPGTAASALTHLIRDLSLSEGPKPGGAPLALPAPPAAPPSKRQCRSLSSDELGGAGRSPWRPQGSSRVWAAVEKKRRCHSGGSVGRGGPAAGGGFPSMQRSFSLCQTRPLHPPSPPLSSPLSPASPRSTPELGRRRCGGAQLPGALPGGGLSRSRSQPCVLNDRKAGMKRRRAEEQQEPRPSLDLAKMTQNLQSFHSMSCPGISSFYTCQSNHGPLSRTTSCQSETEFASVSDLGVEPGQEVSEEVGGDEEDLSYEELDSDSACSVDSRSDTPGGEDGGTFWSLPGFCGTGADLHQLGGELDIEQIERN